MPASVTGEGVAPGEAMHALMRRLFPICRSLTGGGVRETLRIIGEYIPVTVHEVPSGTRTYDWTVPQEWNIRDAFIGSPDGTRLVDFKASTLHVVGYSLPVRARMTLEQLKPHLHSLPDQPDCIPYRTAYGGDTWGFCLSQRVLESLGEGPFDVCIDATLAPGSLTYAECVLEGSTTEEILISTHVCHPSLANDNLSGIAVATWLARTAGTWARKHTFRFVFLPATFGSIAWLARNEARTGQIRHGLVLACLGDAGSSTYKRSRRGSAAVDQAAEYVLASTGAPHSVIDFVPFGYDERQYCSPGFNLPVGVLTRTPNGRFPEYHTSADNLDFVKAWALEDSLAKALRILDILERDGTYENLNPRCEPQLGRRGLYHGVGSGRFPPDHEIALLWVLNFSDGSNSLLDIARRSGLPFEVLRGAADALLAHELIVAAEPRAEGSA